MYRNMSKCTFGRGLGEDSDQTTHLCSLIKVFNWRCVDSKGPMGRLEEDSSQAVRVSRPTGRT